MDEIENAIKGQVDKWRIDRRNAYYIVLSGGTMKHPPTIFELFPLPYDHELQGPKTTVEQLEDFYKSVTSQWN